MRSDGEVKVLVVISFRSIVALSLLSIRRQLFNQCVGLLLRRGIISLCLVATARFIKSPLTGDQTRAGTRTLFGTGSFSFCHTFEPIISVTKTDSWLNLTETRRQVE